jgi:uncharacterized membrane protein YccC
VLVTVAGSAVAIAVVVVAAIATRTKTLSRLNHRAPERSCQVS